MPQKRKASTPKKVKPTLTPSHKLTNATHKPTKSQNRILKEIRFYQTHVNHLVPRRPFARLIRGICNDLGTQFRWKVDALEALHEAAEMYLVSFMEHSNLLAHHAGRVTLFPRDMQLLKRLRL